MKTLQKTLPNFLEKTSGDREVSLLIAHDLKEVKSYKSALAKAQYSLLTSPGMFMTKIKKGGSFFIDLNECTKDWYDCLAQYGTGQVELFDSAAMRSAVVVPPYTKLSLVVVTTAQALSNAAHKGFDLRTITGLCYQS